MVIALVLNELVFQDRGRKYKQRGEPRLGAMSDPDIRFVKTQLMNVSEQRAMHELKMLLRHLGRDDCVICPQVSVQGVIQVEAPSKRGRISARNHIQAKRFDFVVMDKSAEALIAIEYNGGGHHRRGSKKRDAIKRAVCEKAGLPLIVIEYPQEVQDVKDQVREALSLESADEPVASLPGIRPRLLFNALLPHHKNTENIYYVKYSR
ncbi:MAG: DUF2726 domain-containing protein [Pseudomonadota bacterium]